MVRARRADSSSTHSESDHRNGEGRPPKLSAVLQNRTSRFVRWLVQEDSQRWPLKLVIGVEEGERRGGRGGGA